MLLRSKGVRVRGVALLGEHAFLTLMVRKGMTLDAAGLRGRHFGVPSLQDTSAYALSALIRRAGLAPSDVTIRAAPPTELIAALGSGELAGIVGTVDWGVKAERSGAALDYYSADDVFPALAQVVMASDATIAQHPTAIRSFVSTTLAAIGSIRRDPAAAAKRYAAAVPNSGFSQAEIARIFGLLSTRVYGSTRGRFDATRMDAAARAAIVLDLVPAGSTARGSYTNAFTDRR
jgi:NitT/TauT family transport system substrate-binding protein